MAGILDSLTSVVGGLSSDFGSLATTVSDVTTTQAAETTTSSSISTQTASTATSTSTVSTKSSKSSSISTTTSSSSTASTTITSSTLTTSSSPTPTTSTPANPISQPTSTPTPSSNGNNISVSGIAVAATFGFLIVLGVLFLLWKYLPAARRYRERQYEARSHRKGLSLDSSEAAADADEEALHLDDPKQGLGLRKFSFHASPTYYPGMSHEPPAEQTQAQTLPWNEQHAIARKPLTSRSQSQSQIQNEDEPPVSPISVRSMTGETPYSYLQSQYTTPMPSSLQSRPTSQPTTYRPYRDARASQTDVRASQIGVAVPIATPRVGQQGQWQGQRREGNKGLPPLPMNGNGYGHGYGYGGGAAAGIGKLLSRQWIDSSGTCSGS